MKTLGIVAGMGPFAATYFIRRILQLTPARKEWEHIRMHVDYNVHIPSRTRALLYSEASPAPGTVETIIGLEKAGADFVAIPCNSAHNWYEEVSSQINIPWLNLIETTANAVKAKGLCRVLIAGAYVTVTQRLYDKYLDDTLYLTESELEHFYSLIEQLKLDHDKSEVKQSFYQLVKPYEGKVDAIVLACTEPSMLFGIQETTWKSFQIIDSTNEYAKKCVQLCKGIEL